MEDSTTQPTPKPRGLHSVNRRFSRLFGVECTALRLLNFFEFNAAARQSVAQHLAQYQASDRTPAPDLDKPEQWAALRTEMAGMTLAQRIAAAWDAKRPQAERCAILGEFIDQRELTALAVQSAQGGAQTATPTASPTAASAAPSAKRRPQSKHARRPRTAQIKRSS